MRFTKYQYDVAIRRLKEASEQLEPDARCCACCGDSGYQAFECGHNPLYAMALCESMVEDARKVHDRLHAGDRVNANWLHDIVHWLGGFDFSMGEVVGPAAVHLPFATKEEHDAALAGGPVKDA